MAGAHRCSTAAISFITSIAASALAPRRWCLVKFAAKYAQSAIFTARSCSLM